MRAKTMHNKIFRDHTSCIVFVFTFLPFYLFTFLPLSQLSVFKFETTAIAVYGADYERFMVV